MTRQISRLYILWKMLQGTGLQIIANGRPRAARIDILGTAKIAQITFMHNTKIDEVSGATRLVGNGQMQISRREQNHGSWWWHDDITGLQCQLFLSLGLWASISLYILACGKPAFRVPFLIVVNFGIVLCRRGVSGIPVRVKRKGNAAGQEIVTGRCTQTRYIEVGLIQVAAQRIEHPRISSCTLSRPAKVCQCSIRA